MIMKNLLLSLLKNNYYIYLFYIIKIEYIKKIDCSFKILFVDFKDFRIFWEDFKI